MQTVVPIASEIRRARVAAGLTQRQAAVLVGYSLRTFRRFEHGDVPMRAAVWESLQRKVTGVAAEAVLREGLDAAAARFRRELGAGRRVDVSSVDALTPGTAVRDYRRLLRLAIATCEPEPTLQQVADWCGFSVHVLRSWLRPSTSRSARAMPKHAMRLCLWELSARDQSGTDWTALFAACR